MEWTVHPELRHVNAIIEKELAMRQAAAAVSGSVAAAAQSAKLMVWIWFQSPDAADGNPQRCALVLTSELETTTHLKQTPNYTAGRFYDPDNDEWHDIASPLVVMRRTKIVAITDAPDVAKPLPARRPAANTLMFPPKHNRRRSASAGGHHVP